MVEVAGSLGSQLGAALRTERFLRSTSQRALAHQLGVSKSFIGRLESGDLTGSAAAVARLVEQLGLAFAIVVPDEDLGSAMVDDSPEARELAERWRRSGRALAEAAGDGGAQDRTGHDDRPSPDGAEPSDDAFGPPPPDRRPSWLLSSRAPSDASSRTGPEDLTVPGQPPPTRAGRRVVVGVPAAQRELRMERFYDDPVAQVVARSWIVRADRERVRDAAGRRMPAHVVCFPIQLPRMWWPCRHVGWDWRKRPIWSWRRHPLWVVEAVLTGPNPPPLGAHPFGGYPMQGHPSQDVRADWPPDPSTPAGRRRRASPSPRSRGPGGAHWPA